MIKRVIKSCIILASALGVSLLVGKAVLERDDSYKVYGRHFLVEQSSNELEDSDKINAIYSAKAYADIKAGKLVQVREYTGPMNRLVLFRIGFCMLMSKDEAEKAEESMNAILEEFKKRSGISVREVECEKY